MRLRIMTAAAPLQPGPMPPAPIGGSFAWQAASFRDYDSWALRVTAAEIAEIEAAAAATRASGLDIRAIEKRDFRLPTRAPRLAGLRRRVLEDVGFGYVRGLPVERWDADFRMRVYWGMSRHLGDPVPQNRNGHLIGHVIDIGTQVGEVDKRLTQTNAELSFHVDSCDVVALLCLATSMSGGESAIVSGVAVHDEMMRAKPDLCAATEQFRWIAAARCRRAARDGTRCRCFIGTAAPSPASRRCASMSTRCSASPTHRRSRPNSPRRSTCSTISVPIHASAS
jgi:hypothetical protein